MKPKGSFSVAIAPAGRCRMDGRRLECLLNHAPLPRDDLGHSPPRPRLRQHHVRPVVVGKHLDPAPHVPAHLATAVGLLHVAVVAALGVDRGEELSHFRGEREPAQWLRHGARDGTGRIRLGAELEEGRGNLNQEAHSVPLPCRDACMEARLFIRPPSREVPWAWSSLASKRAGEASPTNVR